MRPAARGELDGAAQRQRPSNTATYRFRCVDAGLGQRGRPRPRLRDGVVDSCPTPRASHTCGKEKPRFLGVRKSSNARPEAAALRVGGQVADVRHLRVQLRARPHPPPSAHSLSRRAARYSRVAASPARTSRQAAALSERPSQPARRPSPTPSPSPAPRAGVRRRSCAGRAPPPYAAAASGTARLSAGAAAHLRGSRANNPRCATSSDAHRPRPPRRRRRAHRPTPPHPGASRPGRPASNSATAATASAIAASSRASGSASSGPTTAATASAGGCGLRLTPAPATRHLHQQRLLNPSGSSAGQARHHRRHISGLSNRGCARAIVLRDPAMRGEAPDTYVEKRGSSPEAGERDGQWRRLPPWDPLPRKVGVPVSGERVAERPAHVPPYLEGGGNVLAGVRACREWCVLGVPRSAGRWSVLDVVVSACSGFGGARDWPRACSSGPPQPVGLGLAAGG